MIGIKNLNKKYGADIIYSDADYKFNERGITCFLGPSGSGKTTLLNLLAAFDKDYDGEIMVNETELKDLSLEEGCKYRFNNIGFVFQHYNLLKGYTALENIMMPLNLDGNLTEKEKVNKSESILKELGLESKINQKVETLSGGEKQRVSIGRALINNPQIILADEPTGALDKENTMEIMKVLKDISKDKTVIIITHDEDVAKYADEIIHLDDNKLKILSTSRVCDEKGEVAFTDESINEDKKSEVRDKNATKKNGKAQLSSKKSNELALKNIKVNITKFLIAALLIAFSCAAFVGALGSKDILNYSINDFKEKNFFYNFGIIPIYVDGMKVNEDSKEIYEKLLAMDMIENVYYQYNMKNVRIGDIDISEKMPTDISKVSMVYGNMPRDGEMEVVLSPSLAKQINSNIKELIGEDIRLSYINKNGENEEIQLKISGITDLKYSDFTLSTDLEKNIYEKTESQEVSGIGFYIKDFNDIPLVHKSLKDSGIEVFTKAEEVENFQKTFGGLIKLYSFVSIIILIVGMSISILMLYKICVERHKEIGILSAIGYSKGNVKRILSKEGLIFAVASTAIAMVLLNIVSLIYKYMFGYGIQGAKYLVIVTFMNLLCAIVVTKVINSRLINTEPIKALNKLNS